jgi:hypothetical protein
MEKSTCDCCKNYSEIYAVLKIPTWLPNEKGDLEYNTSEYKVCYACYLFSNNSGVML